MTGTPAASIVIPTRRRAGYLDVTLASLAPQAAAAATDMIVMSDDRTDLQTREVAHAHGARCLDVPAPGGINAARNAGVREAAGELVVFADDDIEAAPGWLDALIAAAAERPDHDVFGGQIVPRFEGWPPRSCGREEAPITSLRLGDSDRDVDLVWGSNMAVRRGAFERVGTFDETIAGCGDEEDWEHRYRALGGRVRYVAGAVVFHRRTAADSRLRALTRAAHGRGRAARRYDTHRGAAPSLPRELRILAGCVWHTARRGCANGIVMGAHSIGRVHEALALAPRRALAGERAERRL